MRKLLIPLLMTLATQAGADDKAISGMLACSSNENNMAPIIYTFDGEHLLRDNQLENPFENIASLTNTTDLHFAFVPRKIVLFKADAAKSLTEKPDLVQKNSGHSYVFVKKAQGTLIFDSSN